MSCAARDGEWAGEGKFADFGCVTDAPRVTKSKKDETNKEGEAMELDGIS